MVWLLGKSFLPLALTESWCRKRGRRKPQHMFLKAHAEVHVRLEVAES